MSRHAEEASFLWLLRSRAVHAPHYSLSDLAKLDGRLEAHLDGLRIAGTEGWRLCVDELAWEEPGEVFAAGVLAFESGMQKRIGPVMDKVGQNRELTRGLTSAIGWLTDSQAEPHIRNLLSSDQPNLQNIGISASAIRRRDPGPALAKEPLDSRKLRAIGELGRRDLLALLQSHLQAEDENCRFWAAWSLALLSNDGPALSMLTSNDSGRQLALRRMDLASALAIQRELGPTRAGIIAAGIIGDPVLAPWLISLMPDPVLARVAGEAFSAITGADIAYEDLDAPRPDGFEAGPTEDPDDENVALDPDENLAWPNPVAVADWWRKRAHNFTSGTRYLLGKPITEDWLQTVLRQGRQRIRAAAALELAIRHPGRPLFNVKAPGFRQQEVLQGS